MEMFNWLFNRDNRTNVLKDLVYMDSHYIDEDYINRFYSVSKIPYYVHFSHLKPHLSRRISACLDESRIKNATPEFFKVHRTFWNYYYRYCWMKKKIFWILCCVIYLRAHRVLLEYSMISWDWLEGIYCFGHLVILSLCCLYDWISS